jgi:aspartate aminotransferase
MLAVAQHLSKIEPSASLAIAAEARRLRSLGRPVIDLSVGELDFPTPAGICEAAIRAIHRGATRYDATSGILPLREAISAKLKREIRLDYAVDQISVGCGAKQIISSALFAILDPDDEVIIPVPYWTSYPEMVRLARGKPVLAECAPSDGFKLRPETLDRLVTPRTKCLLLNSPNNPSGAVYNAAELAALAEALARHPQVGVISDDIYENMAYSPGKFENIAAIDPRLCDRTIIVSGVSKTYAMTGWRVGYGAGPTHIMRAINTIQSQTTTHTSTISQYAALEALNGSQMERGRYADVMSARAKRTVELINKTPGLSCSVPQGAFYCYVNCADLIGKRSRNGVLNGDIDVAAYLLETALVAVVPGAAYGLSPYLRISFAADNEVVEDGFERIAASIKELV